MLFSIDSHLKENIGHRNDMLGGLFMILGPFFSERKRIHFF